MTQYRSTCERKAAPLIAALGGKYCESFAPFLPETYEDAEGVELRGKPDYLIQRDTGHTFIETKDGVLNNHYTEAESTEALRYAYGQVFGRCGDHLDQSALANSLYSVGLRGQIYEREHAFHNSLWKVLALQAKHGWQRYLVVFKTNPKPTDAARYCKAGLVWCTNKTLPNLLRCIDLMRYGIYLQFSFSSTKYIVTVTPDSSIKGMSQPEVEFIDRGRFLAAVAADKDGISAQRAQDETNDTGLLPY